MIERHPDDSDAELLDLVGRDDDAATVLISFGEACVLVLQVLAAIFSMLLLFGGVGFAVRLGWVAGALFLGLQP